jgi:hypothetical protein
MNPLAGRAEFGPQARFALYYAPPVASRWWSCGCSWLERDPERGERLEGPRLAGLSRPLAELTSEPRRYGWHATLVPPFRLVPGVTVEQLVGAARDWAARQRPQTLAVQVARVGGFMAVVPRGPPGVPGIPRHAALEALAADALRILNLMRAAPGPDEVMRRKAPGLSSRQSALLDAWGYPYVLDEFRFHMTLSNRIEGEDAPVIQAWWEERLPNLGPLPIDGAAVFVQPGPDTEFLLWERLPFSSSVA